MPILVLIAWRNIWRNKLRTTTVLLAVALGLSGGIFAIAFSKGFSQQLVQEVTNMENPHISLLPINAPAITGIRALVPDALSLADSLNTSPGIQIASPRLNLDVVLASAYASNNVTLTGVIPDKEQELTALARHIAPGNGYYLDPSQPGCIVIGRQLADELNIQLNTRIVATFQGFDGGLASMALLVCGIYDYQNTTFERRHAFVLYDELAEWSEAPKNAASEIGLKLTNGLPAVASEKDRLITALPALMVVGWSDQRPEIAFVYHYIDLMNALVIIVILMALSLGVVNIMLMVVNERRVELGMLRAIGMKNHKVVSMVVLETLFLMLLGTAISIVIWVLLMVWLGNTGLDLSMYLDQQVGHGHAYQNNYNVVNRIYPVFDFTAFLYLSMLVIATGLLASWMPCRRALKIQPAEAVNTNP